MLDLAGTWTLADAQGEHEVPMRLPGDVHSALLAAGRIPDPYHGRNEYAVRWVADRDWTAARSFDLPHHAGHRLLVLDGLDTIAEVRVNGHAVLDAASSFREHVTDVSGALVHGANRIEICFRSSLRAADALQAAQPFPVPYHAGNCPIPNGNMLRKPQCDFGWDWNIAVAPLGLHVRIALIDGGGEIAGAKITQTHAPGTVSLDIDVALRGFAEEAVDWRIAIGDAEASGGTDPRSGHLAATLTLRDPALWWPAGLGNQPLHDLAVTVGEQTRSFRIALRDVRLVSEPDAN
jgi:beta-mannosidase